MGIVVSAIVLHTSVVFSCLRAGSLENRFILFYSLVNVCLRVRVCHSVCVCACVRERKSDRERGRERECACVCVCESLCVCETQRQIASLLRVQVFFCLCMFGCVETEYIYKYIFTYI